jgi:iron complex outermembrane receptor protein
MGGLMQRSLFDCSRRARLLITTALSVATLSNAPAFAQTAEVEAQPSSGATSPQTSQSSPVNADDIVVTARRTSERLSDVPVSVAAMGEQQLNEKRILTDSDLQSATPGLTVRQTNSSNQISFSLRGQSVDAFSFAAPAVLNYVNEFNAQSTSASAFFDLDSIQTLKGPQGTLFGRNATGGAVLYSTKKPDDKFGGYLRASYGNFDNKLLEGAINIPGEVISGRVAAQYQKRDGYQHNLLLGIRGGSVDTFSVRPTIQIETGDFKNVTVYQYNYSGGYSASLRLKSYYGVNGSSGANGDPLNNFVNGQPVNNSLNFGLPSATLYPDGIAAVLEGGERFAQFGFSGLPSFYAAQKNYGFYDVFDDQDGRHRGRQHTVTNTTTFDLSDDMQVKNIFGYNYSFSRDNTDVDGTPFDPLQIGFGGGTGPGNPGDPAIGGRSAEGYSYRSQQMSDELQVSGTSGSLKYIAGLYYFKGKEYQRLALDFAPDYPAALGDNLGFFLREYTNKTTSKAAYAQATYAITDALNFTAGGRWTWEKTTYTPKDRVAGSYDPLQDDLNTSLGITGGTLKADKPSWNLSLDYKITPSLLIYAAQRGSWRTGGFNGTASSTDANGNPIPNSFAPETTYDFEIGSKFNGFVGDMPTTVNLAVYNQEIKHVIRAIYLGVAAVSGNVDKARVRGLELDASIRPAPWLQFGGTLAYTDAKYVKNTATVGDTIVQFGPYGDVPKWSGSVFGRVEHELADRSVVSLRGDLYSQSSFYFSNASATILPDTKIDGYTLLDVRAEWAKIGGSEISLTAYVKNLTDKKYNVGGFALGAVNGLNSVLPGLPRMYGLEARVEF